MELTFVENSNCRYCRLPLDEHQVKVCGCGPVHEVCREIIRNQVHVVLCPTCRLHYNDT